MNTVTPALSLAGRLACFVWTKTGPSLKFDSLQLYVVRNERIMGLKSEKEVKDTLLTPPS